jgi:hypothetical protein
MDRSSPKYQASQSYEALLHDITARFDQLEVRLGNLINKVITEVNNGNKPKNLLLDDFFSTFCALKAWDEDHPSARDKSSLNWFFRFLKEGYPK